MPRAQLPRARLPGLSSICWWCWDPPLGRSPGPSGRCPLGWWRVAGHTAAFRAADEGPPGSRFVAGGRGWPPVDHLATFIGARYLFDPFLASASHCSPIVLPETGARPQESPGPHLQHPLHSFTSWGGGGLLPPPKAGLFCPTPGLTLPLLRCPNCLFFFFFFLSC